MNSIIKEMLSHYQIVSLDNEKMAMKEVVQEVILCALYKAGFFEIAAFYGGTSLRIFHGLDRFSEDLDFSLIKENPSFEWSPYFPFLEKEFESLGLRFRVIEKKNSKETSIRSAFAKGNLKETILEFFPADSSSLHPDEMLTIKFKVDTLPPHGGEYEMKYRLLPSYYGARLFKLPFLFAGKIGAILTRKYSSRVKGRDLYDYLFYLSKGVKVNLPYVSELLNRSGLIKKEELSLDGLKKLLFDRFEAIDYSQAKADVAPFMHESSKLDIWDADFFKGITESYLFCD